MNFDKGAYRTVTPMVRPPTNVRVALTYEDGRIEGFVADCDFTIGGKKARLSDVRSLRFSKTPIALLTESRTFSGATTGLDGLVVSFGARSIRVDATKAIELTVEPPAAETKVEYTITVRRDGKELARFSDAFGFNNAPGGTEFSGIAAKLNGLWLLDRDEANGGTWPIHGDGGVRIENQRIVWVKDSGKDLSNSPRAQLKIDASKSPMTMDLEFPNSTWHAIFKIEGNRLTIATNCNDERRPAQFTTNLTAGIERATFVRVYKLKPKSEK
jgi:uncharacterized protein (TIGR03067 family)